MRALVLTALLSMIAAPAALAQACGDEGRYFHLKPPEYSYPSHRKRVIHRKAKALRWYREHNGNVLVCPESYIEGITVTTSK
ncbi:hypothetical protein KF707_17060 [Candidatus Obscuribacterales bacterium]|nr:hypothetical protein [Candidatus Obscuribacterales bacterium]MBX3151962.1 hypothetical protein [Candidatus Obscuribacterales bacterium]